MALKQGGCCRCCHLHK